MLAQIDHFIWGVSDLETGCAEIERRFGVAPQPGGSHPGLGTCNALLSLGSETYLEIMAPDRPGPGSVGQRLAQLDEPGLISWVLRSADLAQIMQTAAERCPDLVPLGPVKSERLTPQGERLAWQLLFLTGHAHGGLVPFYIDWQDSPHPSASAPLGGQANALVLASPQAGRLGQLFSELGIDIAVSSAAPAQLSVQVETPAGIVMLRCTPQSLTVLEM